MTAEEASEITEEKIAKLRERLGIVWRPRLPYFNTVAGKDAIQHFCAGIGDTNPLFNDEEYARKTSYGRLVAPPCFLYSVYWAAQGRGMPGIHAWHSGDEWEFYQPIVEGDEFTYTNELVDVRVRESQMAAKTVIQYHEIIYYHKSTGEKMARCLDWCVRAGRRSAGERRKYGDIKAATYAADDMKRIYEAYEAEEIRGASPRYWEDVQVGDALPSIVKGPLSRRDIYAWLIGAGSPFMKAHGLAFSFLQRHPGTDMVDSRTGVMDVPELVHMEDTRAQEVGVPGAYDYGCQRISWLGNLLTNWMGDDGFLKGLRAELRRFNIVGDTTYLKGKVGEKYVRGGEHLVDIECWAENQRAEVTMPGTATVRLPSRSR